MLNERAKSIIDHAIETMEKGYRTGDFSEFIEYLSGDCEIKTHLRIKKESIVGFDAVKAHFEAEGKWITDKEISASYILPVRSYMHPEEKIYLMPVWQRDKTCIKKHTFMTFEEEEKGSYDPVQIFHEKGKTGLLIVGPGIPFTYVDLVLNSEGKVKRILLLDPVFFHYGEKVTVDVDIMINPSLDPSLF